MVCRYPTILFSSSSSSNSTSPWQVVPLCPPHRCWATNRDKLPFSCHLRPTCHSITCRNSPCPWQKQALLLSLAHHPALTLRKMLSKKHTYALCPNVNDVSSAWSTLNVICASIPTSGPLLVLFPTAPKPSRDLITSLSTWRLISVMKSVVDSKMLSNSNSINLVPGCPPPAAKQHIPFLPSISVLFLDNYHRTHSTSA